MSKAPAKAEPPAAESEVPVKKSKKNLIIIIVIVLVLAIGGGGAWFFLVKNKEAAEDAAGNPDDPAAAAKKAAKQEPPKPPVYVVLDTFTVNLQSEDGDQFLQLAISLQVADQAQVDMIKLYMPQVRSRLLLLLSSKKASEISTPEGKKKLADEILVQTKQPFSKDATAPDVSNVFFTSFVIQ